jgi:hypothetical protein
MLNENGGLMEVDAELIGANMDLPISTVQKTTVPRCRSIAAVWCIALYSAVLSLHAAR